MAKQFTTCTYGNGELQEVSDDFFKKCEEQSKDKEDELKYFCSMLNYKDKNKVWTWFKKNVDIVGNPKYKISVIEFLIGFGKHKVDGNIWSNGCFGSRWSDKVDGCRIAFYSRKLDPSSFEGTEELKLTKPYWLLIMGDEEV